jgi:hypothetical protein
MNKMVDSEVMEALLLLASFILLALLAPRFGADSRHLDDGFRD